MSNVVSIESHLKFEKVQRERRLFIIIHSFQYLEAFEAFISVLADRSKIYFLVISSYRLTISEQKALLLKNDLTASAYMIRIYCLCLCDSENQFHV